MGLMMLSRIDSNSWVQVVLLPQLLSFPISVICECPVLPVLFVDTVKISILVKKLWDYVCQGLSLGLNSTVLVHMAFFRTILKLRSSYRIRKHTDSRVVFLMFPEILWISEQVFLLSCTKFKDILVVENYWQIIKTFNSWTWVYFHSLREYFSFNNIFII